MTRAPALPRTIVQRLVTSLESEQLVSITDGKVRLGPVLTRLAVAAHKDIRTQLRPYPEARARETNETVNLCVLRDNRTVLVD